MNICKTQLAKILILQGNTVQQLVRENQEQEKAKCSLSVIVIFPNSLTTSRKSHWEQK